MKSEEEVRKELKEWENWIVENIKRGNYRFFCEAIGYISALKWVLEE